MADRDDEHVRREFHRLLLGNLAVEISEAMTAAGVTAILLKGPVTARLLYDDPRLRRYADIDLLICPAEEERASAVLQRLGYSSPLANASPLERSSHGTEYVSDKAEVDLHRRLPGVGADPETAWRVLAAGTEPLDLDSGVVTVLAPPAQALHVALNAANMGNGERAAEELGLAMRRLPQALWQDAAELAVGLDCENAVLAGFDLVPGGLAFARRLGLQGEIPVGSAVRARASTIAVVRLEDFASRRGVRAKVAFATRELVPTPAFLKANSSLAGRGWPGLALAYVLRPFEVGRRLGPAAREWFSLRRAHRPRG